MRLLKALLQLYPAAFRARYAEEMEEVLREGRGSWWTLREAGGLVAGAWTEWRGDSQLWRNAGRRIGSWAVALLLQGLAYWALTPVGPIATGRGTYLILWVALAGLAAAGALVLRGHRLEVAA